MVTVLGAQAAPAYALERATGGATAQAATTPAREATNPTGQDSTGEDPTDQSSAEPKPAEPKPADPGAAEPEAAEPEATGPEPAEATTADPDPKNTADQKGTAGTTTKPSRTGPRAAATTSQQGGVTAQATAPAPTGVQASVDSGNVTITWDPQPGVGYAFFLGGWDTYDEAGCSPMENGPCSLPISAGDYYVWWLGTLGEGDLTPVTRTDVQVTCCLVQMPQNVVAESTVHGVAISWEPSSAVDTYTVTAGPADGTGATGSCEPMVAESASSLIGCTIDGLSYELYNISVVAIAGESRSDPATTTATPLSEKPGTPILTGANAVSNSINVSWTPVTSAYGVPITYTATAKASAVPDQSCTGVTGTSCVISNLSYGSAYTISVVAHGDVDSDAGTYPGSVVVGFPFPTPPIPFPTPPIPFPTPPIPFPTPPIPTPTPTPTPPTPTPTPPIPTPTPTPTPPTPTPTPTPPTPPQNVAATPRLHGLDVSWGLSPSGASRYRATAEPAVAGTGPTRSCEPILVNGFGAATTDLGCRIDNLPAVLYRVTVVASLNGLSSTPATVTATPLSGTPVAPAVTRVTPGADSLAVAWETVSGASSYTVTARGTDGSSGTCTAAVSPCTISDLAAGVEYEVAVKATGPGGTSPAGVAGRGIPTGVPVLPPAVPVGATKLHANVEGGGNPTAGGTITVSGEGFRPGSIVVIAIYSQPRVLARVTVRADGTFSVPVVVPEDLLGEHTFVATGLGRDGKVRYLTLPVSVSTSSGSGGGADLPRTGTPLALFVLLGAAMVTAGAGSLYIGRRPVA
ncbi:hypothetical protein [Micromonospora sp. NPDC049679]|uniref:hypothetical protein n=1 Tax=Micromonospora sp. NPDC049679 TaxID=3155920 RepID=UPI0033F1D491